MKTGTILRGCTLNDEYKNEKEILAERMQSEIEELSQNTSLKFNKLLDVFAEEMRIKIESLDKYKYTLNSEYDTEKQKLKQEAENTIKKMKQEHDELIIKQENEFKAYLNTTQSLVKELMLILFEKFFFTQYKDPENLNSIIEEGLRQLEDNSKVQISLHRELFNTLSKGQIDKLNTNTNPELELVSLNTDTLLIEMKSETENIEIDFEKQMKKISDAILTF